MRMWASGLMSAFNPVEAGGVEPSFAEMIETWIEMAWQDGSFGWIGIANLPSSFAAARVSARRGLRRGVHRARQPRHDGRPVLPQRAGHRRRRAATGSPARGVSVRAPATPSTSRRVSCRWTTARCAGSAKVCPTCRSPCVPRDEVTSTTAGMCRGSREPAPTTTASHDVFVPQHRTFALFTREPQRGTSPATRMGMMPVTAAGHAAWALGVAKSMLDDVQELAATKFRMSDMASLASRPTFQKGLAHHVAAWRAARLLVLDAFTTAEAAVAVGRRR